jgi:site-specific DNA recombinase
VPAIITQELWDECQSIKSGKTHRNYLTSYTYLLKDLITCGCCGRNFYAKYKPAKDGDKVYICSSRLKKGEGCGQTGVNISLIESAIFDQMIKSETLAKYVNKEKEVLENLNLEIEDLNTQLKIDNTSLEKKYAESKRILDAYSLGNISPELLDAKSGEIQNQINVLNEKIKRTGAIVREKQRAISKYNEPAHSSIRMFYEAMDNREELRTMFQQFIERVTVHTISDIHIVADIAIKLNGMVMPTSLKILLDKKSVRTGLRYMILPEATDIKHSEFQGQVSEFVEFKSWIPIEHQILVEPLSVMKSLTA